MDKNVFIEMRTIDINFYCLELVNPIAKISYYYQFFPLWIDYHFLQKHMIDEDFKEIYISDLAESKKVEIKFDSVNIRINEYEISSAAILQANMHELETNELKNNVVNYLKRIKSNQLSLIVNNFTINVESWREKICQYYQINNKVYYYYKNINDSKIRIKLEQKIDINFAEILLFHEKKKLIDLRDFMIIVENNSFNQVQYLLQ